MVKASSFAWLIEGFLDDDVCLERGAHYVIGVLAGIMVIARSMALSIFIDSLKASVEKGKLSPTDFGG